MNLQHALIDFDWRIHWDELVSLHSCIIVSALSLVALSTTIFTTNIQLIRELAISEGGSSGAIIRSGGLPYALI